MGRFERKIPAWLQYKKGGNETSPVWFIDCRDTAFLASSPSWQERINSFIEEILRQIHSDVWEGPVLIKCHVGERKCTTRMLPEYCISTKRHFNGLGMNRIVTGDTTVAYTGERGYKENIHNCNSYLTLAEDHGWTEKGPLGIPFIVLDRPQTSIEGILNFKDEALRFVPGNTKIFREIYLAGGFIAAGTIINHVHLTLHDMAQVACSVKGITMGLSSYLGKLIMHKCYFPFIDITTCKRCGTCVAKCPEGALLWEKGNLPQLDRHKCIGCGECVAICKNGSVTMQSSEIKDWLMGEETLPFRMADYLIGMMEGRWERLVNIVHMYNITRRCDCVDEVQTALIPDIGFLIGRNPFSVDLMAIYLLHNAVDSQIKKGRLQPNKQFDKNEILKIFFPGYHGIKSYKHIERDYGIVVEPDPIIIKAV